MARQTVPDNEYQTGAILWTQSSAEYRALAYQAFALARLRFDADLRTVRERYRIVLLIGDNLQRLQ